VAAAVARPQRVPLRTAATAFLPLLTVPQQREQAAAVLLLPALQAVPVELVAAGLHLVVLLSGLAEQ
jgi:hypothetical protein